MMEVTVARIGHVAITVRDLERTVDFYSRFVGLCLTETLLRGVHARAGRRRRRERQTAIATVSSAGLREGWPASGVIGLGPTNAGGGL